MLEAKRAIIQGDLLTYGGTEYKATCLIWQYVKGEDQYSVQLVDLTAKHSTIQVKIQDLFKE